MIITEKPRALFMPRFTDSKYGIIYHLRICLRYSAVHSFSE